MVLVDVLLVSPWHSGPGASGVVTACRHLAEGLARHADVGRVTVLSLGAGRRSEEICDGAVRVETIPRQARLALATYGLPDYRRAARWLDETGFRPAVVHGQGLAGEGLLATRLARRLEVPAVVTVHGMIDKETSLYGDPVRAFLARRVMVRTLRRASGIVFVSPYRREELALDASVEARVIPNAVSGAVFDVDREPSGNTILYAGFVGPRKRLLDLVRALPAVRQEVPRARLRVAGPRSDEAYAREVDAEVARLGLEDAVAFLGALDPPSLHAEYARASVLALPSEEENAPQVIAEAMAAGLPVVATDVGGVGWMVKDGAGGYLVPPRDVEALAARLVTVLDAGAAEVSATARREAERFAPSRVAEETVALYRALEVARS